MMSELKGASSNSIPANIKQRYSAKFFQPSKEIFFTLMAYRQHGHGVAVFDFK